MSTSVSLQGRELIAAWTLIDRGIAEWVLKLAAFDAGGEWAEDGYASCVSWLSDKCDLGRSAAYEKLKVAHELTRRHVVRTAFEGGLSYSKVRVLVRLDGMDEERDEQFVAHARTDTVRVLEERVNNWNYFATQDKPPANIDDHYGFRREPGFGGGMGRVVLEAPNEMLDRLVAFVDAYGEFLRHNAKPTQLGLEAVDESTVWTDPQESTEEDTETRRPKSAKRLDWLLDLVEEVAFADPKKIDP